MNEFDGARVVVTGGTGALGAAVVERLIEADASCLVTCLLERELESFAPAHDVMLRRADRQRENEVRRLYEDLGNLAASIHLVGGFALAGVTDTSLATFRRLLELNAMPDAAFDRWSSPAEIAETVTFLAGRRDALTSGALPPVFGPA